MKIAPIREGELFKEGRPPASLMELGRGLTCVTRSFSRSRVGKLKYHNVLSLNGLPTPSGAAIPNNPSMTWYELLLSFAFPKKNVYPKCSTSGSPTCNTRNYYTPLFHNFFTINATQ